MDVPFASSFLSEYGGKLTTPAFYYSSSDAISLPLIPHPLHFSVYMIQTATYTQQSR